MSSLSFISPWPCVQVQYSASSHTCSVCNVCAKYCGIIKMFCYIKPCKKCPYGWDIWQVFSWKIIIELNCSIVTCAALLSDGKGEERKEGWGRREGWVTWVLAIQLANFPAFTNPQVGLGMTVCIRYGNTGGDVYVRIMWLDHMVTFNHIKRCYWEM